MRDPALKPAEVTGDEGGLRRQTLEAAEVSDDELDARPRKKVAAGKGGKHHRKTLVDAPTPKAAARAPTTPARAGQRDREIESIAQEFLQDDGPRVSPWWMASPLMLPTTAIAAAR